MEILDEYCLHHIFGYLEPHDLIHISKVCQLWKNVALRHWMKVKTIGYLKNVSLGRTKVNEEKIPVVSTEDAEKIFACSAQFVERLAVYDNFEKDVNFLRFGRFWYKVKELNVYNTFKLLAASSTKITNVCFMEYPPPDVELIKPLFESNKIKKLATLDIDGYYQHLQTDSIVYLQHFSPKTQGQIQSFKGLFPNLKVLKLSLRCGLGENPDILSQVLPHLPKLQILNLSWRPPAHTDVQHTFFDDIAKLSQLRALDLRVSNVNVSSPELFLKKLWTSCPEIRELSVGKRLSIPEETFRSLITLPRLEILKVDASEDFDFVELPEATNLTKLSVTWYFNKWNISLFCSVIYKMDRLIDLEIKFYEFDAVEWSQLFYEILSMLISQQRRFALNFGTFKGKSVEKISPEWNNLNVDENRENFVARFLFKHAVPEFVEFTKTSLKNVLENRGLFLRIEDEIN